MDINTLRNNRNAMLNKIVAQVENGGETQSYEDTRFWKPERDKAGNASATIRFLNAVGTDELPWVKYFSHGFKGPTGRWYIENSLTTLGKADPVSELNMKLWNSTTDDKSPARKQARDQKRKLNYVSNILVVNDPKHPENNGKVFLFKYGKKIHDKIIDKARPTFEDEEPVNVFDYWAGCNFKLRMKKVDGYPNYDSSEWESPSPVASSDEAILEIAKQQYELSEFVSEKNFKSYDALKKKLDQVLNGAPVQERAEEVELVSRPAPSPGPVKESIPGYTSKPSVDDDDEDMMSYFKSIADD